MTGYELVQPRGWTGTPSQYPELHARPIARRGQQLTTLCGLGDVRPVPVDPFYALRDQVTCKRCVRALDRTRDQ